MQDTAHVKKQYVQQKIVPDCQSYKSHLENNLHQNVLVSVLNSEEQIGLLYCFKV